MYPFCPKKRAELAVSGEMEFLLELVLAWGPLCNPNCAPEHVKNQLGWLPLDHQQALTKTLTDVFKQADRTKRNYLAMIHLGEVCRLVRHAAVLEVNGVWAKKIMWNSLKTVTTDVLFTHLLAILHSCSSEPVAEKVLMERIRNICEHAKATPAPLE